MKAVPSSVNAAAPDSPAEIEVILFPRSSKVNRALSSYYSSEQRVPPPISPATNTLPLLDNATENRAPKAMSTINSSLASMKIF
jgi:hypothetical protein